MLLKKTKHIIFEILYNIRNQKYSTAQYILFLTIFYLIFSLQNIHLPGLYYDSVNPDYIASKYITKIDPYINHVPPWTSFPFLGQLYHGMTQFYFSLIFFKIFGISPISIQILHALLGLILVIMVFIFIRKTTFSKNIAFFITLMFLSDPAITFSFRTQSYITLTPMIWLLVSLYLIALEVEIKRPFLIIISGIFYGLAFYGYFIYILFYLPLILLIYKNNNRFTPILKFTMGTFIGSSLYFIGYISLIYHTKGFSWIINNTSSLNVSGDNSSIIETSVSQLQKLLLSFTDYNYLLIFSDNKFPIYGDVKIYILILMIFIGILKIKKPFLSKIWPIFIVLSYFLLSITFGNRLGPHHYVILLPFLYIQISIFLTIEKVKKNNKLLYVLGLFTILSNILYQENIQDKLIQTGGKGYYSDSTYLLGQEALHSKDRTTNHYIFTEWGFNAPFLIITEGKVPSVNGIDMYSLKKIRCGEYITFTSWGDIKEKREIISKASTLGKYIGTSYYYERDHSLSYSTYKIIKNKFCKK